MLVVRLTAENCVEETEGYQCDSALFVKGTGPKWVLSKQSGGFSLFAWCSGNRLFLRGTQAGFTDPASGEVVQILPLLLCRMS